MKKQLKNYIMIVCFLLFIFGFAVASFISEDREFSENENRYLQQAPEFSWKKLEKGEFTSDIESYMSDQIFMKDQLVSLKTVTDRTLLKKLSERRIFRQGRLLSPRLSGKQTSYREKYKLS